MIEEMVRVHVLLPKRLVEQINRTAGARQRSAYIAEAVQREIDRQERRNALREFAGSLKGAAIPEWETPEAAAAWVRQQRRIGTDPWDEVRDREAASNA